MLFKFPHQQFEINKKWNKMNSCVSTRCNSWVTYSTCYQTLIQLMLDVNNWKVVKKWLNNITTFARNLRWKYFPCQMFFHYYKIQHGRKNSMLMNKAIILFNM